ncbi:hypothetical protein PG996_006440 [Apiospora saccharicola]|uniref:Uncharacterized protein n=1 Tax=Apiospora saccharicola TaxID=335842 RepID=A0ABR1VPL3_9PEZI
MLASVFAKPPDNVRLAVHLPHPDLLLQAQHHGAVLWGIQHQPSLCPVDHRTGHRPRGLGYLRQRALRCAMPTFGQVLEAPMPGYCTEKGPQVVASEIISSGLDFALVALAMVMIGQIQMKEATKWKLRFLFGLGTS